VTVLFDKTGERYGRTQDSGFWSMGGRSQEEIRCGA